MFVKGNMFQNGSDFLQIPKYLKCLNRLTISITTLFLCSLVKTRRLLWELFTHFQI